ncbi:MAG: Plug and carboxypeptidase regulatory-like domain-containing protein [Gemmatimonadetes bacterium]|nr:Plug and carboxypeptidase regulatory-like domain-containing protein [Gemmatimonadota bacterium]
MTCLTFLLTLAVAGPVDAVRLARIDHDHTLRPGFAPISFAPLTQDTGASRLVGIVRNLVTGAPLGGVVIELIGTRYTGFTNENGGFLIPEIRPGRYLATVRVEDAAAAGITVDTVTVLLSARVVSHIELRVRPIESEPQQMGLRTPGNTAVAPASDRRGSIVGRVIDRASGDPIVSADITLNRSVRAISNAEGRFAFPLVAAGRGHLAVEHLGYAAENDSIDIRGDQVNDVVVRLGRRPLKLDAIRVEVRSDWLTRNGFYTRRDDPGNFGYFLGREEIELRAADNLPDLLSRAPGIRIDYTGPGRRNVVVRRSYGTSGECSPDLYVDGMRLRGAFNDISPLAIEAIEVYVGPDAPIEYLSIACGVVLVWTKRG